MIKATLLACALPVAALAQTTITNTDTGETLVIDGPPLEAPLAANLLRYLDHGEDGDALATRFEHTGECLYRTTLAQKLDDQSRRETVVDFDVRDLSMDGYEERVHAPNMADLLVPFSDGLAQTAHITLASTGAAPRQQYVDALGLTCDGDTCSGTSPTPTLHLTLLSATGDLGFADMAMGALMNAGRPRDN